MSKLDVRDTTVDPSARDDKLAKLTALLDSFQFDSGQEVTEVLVAGIKHVSSSMSIPDALFFIRKLTGLLKPAESSLVQYLRTQVSNTPGVYDGFSVSESEKTETFKLDGLKAVAPKVYDELVSKIDSLKPELREAVWVPRGGTITVRTTIAEPKNSKDKS